MQRSSAPPPETTPSRAAGVRRRLPVYLLAAFPLALLAAVVTFVYLEQLRASMVPTAAALVALTWTVTLCAGARHARRETGEVGPLTPPCKPC